MPCIILESFFLIKIRITAAKADITTNMTKKEVNPSICNPIKTGLGLDGLGYNVLKSPAIMFEAADDKNQTPIIKHENFNGDNLDTIDNPMGEIHSSPKVITKYTIIR